MSERITVTDKGIAALRVARIQGLLEKATQDFSRDPPLMTVEDWDALFDELMQLEAEHPEPVAPDSPTQRIGPRS